MEPVAILVLGARVRQGQLRGALARRVDAAAMAASHWPRAIVVACGGRGWDGHVEADVIARGLVAGGVDRARVRRDRLSLTTRENLVEAAGMLRRLSCVGTVAIATCDWHLPRALTIGRALGLSVVGVPAIAPPVSLFRTVIRALHERVAVVVDVRLAARST